MTFGRRVDEDGARRLVGVALDAGVSFFDTADSYSQGQSEIMLGKALKGRRRGAVVATKFFNPMGPGRNDSGMSRVHILEAIEDSLSRLQMEYVDLHYIHHVDVQTPLAETLVTLDDLVHQGSKVRYIACSNYQAWRLSEALWISDTKNLARFVCYQPQYSLVVRDIEQEVVPLCLAKGLGIVAWSPLPGGFLAGKYKPGQRQLEGTRSAEHWVFPERFFAPNADETLSTLMEVAEDLGRSPAQVALRWLLEQPGVTAPIVGARTAEQLRDNLGASGWRLEGAALDRLSEVSRLPDRYPESTEKHTHERRDSAVKMPSLRDSS